MHLVRVDNNDRLSESQKSTNLKQREAVDAAIKKYAVIELLCEAVNTSRRPSESHCRRQQRLLSLEHTRKRGEINWKNL